MVTNLGAPHVLHGQVTHYLRHRAERLVARLLGGGLVAGVDILSNSTQNLAKITKKIHIKWDKSYKMVNLKEYLSVPGLAPPRGR